MGPLSNIMNQFPGTDLFRFFGVCSSVKTCLLRAGMSGLDFHESGVRIKKWLTMMDSMTDT